jgi:3-dehydroquinate dehydratase/shikimate dehydrogenase
LILSRHDFQGTPADLNPMLAALRDEPAHVVKLATKAESIVDAVRMLDLVRASAADRPTIGLAMGEAGVLSRILAKKVGGHVTFASLDEGKESAPGQVTIDEMRRLYRWDELNDQTGVYGVIGCPVAHSMSPAILNAAFAAIGHNAVYLPFRVEPDYEDLKAFIDACLVRPWLGLRGCSVTIPHKSNLLRYVEQRGGTIEPLAARIGVANTLFVQPGRLADGSDAVVSASNTDYQGALQALQDGMGCARAQLAGRRVLVVGAGGASRAIVAGLTDAGSNVTISNRTQQRAESLAADFGATVLPWDERTLHDAEIIINCTSIGMWPETDATPMPSEGFRSRSVVFDTVYNPIETRLLREAKQAGCVTVDGVAMFVNQASAQFKLWTGQPAPSDLMRSVVTERLREKR